MVVNTTESLLLCYVFEVGIMTTGVHLVLT